MPKLTISAASTGTIASRNFIGTPATRRALVMTLISGDGVWGWNSDVDASGAATAGIPMIIGQPIAFASEVHTYSGAVYIASAAGAVVNYQELNLP